MLPTGQPQPILARPEPFPGCRSTTEIRGSFGEISGAHVSEATAPWLQTMVSLNAGDTVELQGYFRAADEYFAANQTAFWGAKIG